MDCITFRKLIPGYINKNLNDSELNDFLIHLRSCSHCREELEIHYIVMKGVDILDNNENHNYNLAQAFKAMLNYSSNYIRNRKRIMTLTYVVDTLVLWAVAAAMILFLNTF